MREACQHNIPANRLCLVCASDDGDNMTADDWRREHLGDFVLAVQKCTDVQTLRALAHRLGYKEGT